MRLYLTNVVNYLYRPAFSLNPEENSLTVSNDMMAYLYHHFWVLFFQEIFVAMNQYTIRKLECEN